MDGQDCQWVQWPPSWGSGHHCHTWRRYQANTETQDPELLSKRWSWPSTSHKTTRRMHPPWTKASAWFLTTIWRHPWQTRISIFLDVYFLQSSLISNTYPRHRCWGGGSLGRQARLEDSIKPRAGPLTCDRWKKLKQGGRGGHGLAASTLPKMHSGGLTASSVIILLIPLRITKLAQSCKGL